MISKKVFKYELIFNDGVRYLSPDIRRNDPGWANEFCEKPIKELKFYLPDERILILCNFEAYNFFVECSESIFGGNIKIDAFYFCGKYHDKVLMWKVDIKNRRIVKTLSKFGEEYVGTPTRGWRPGIFGYKPNSGILMGE